MGFPLDIYKIVLQDTTMTLEYALREGFIDLRRFPMREDGGRGFTALIHPGAGFTAKETPLGLIFIDNKTGDSRLLDSDLLGEYAVEQEILININVPAAMADLKLA